MQTHMTESTPDLSFSWVTNQKHEASSPSLCMPLWIPGKTLSPLPVYSSASNLLCFLSHQECGARLPCMQTDTLWKGPSSKNMHRTSLWIRRDGVRRKSEVGKDRTGFSLSSQGERIWESYQSSGCMFWCIIPGICPLSSPSAESISGITLPRISLSRTQNSSQGFPWDVPNK